MVGTAGFEPTTPCPPGRCATRLRYAPTRAQPRTSLRAGCGLYGFVSVAAASGADTLVELGSGTSDKTRLLLDLTHLALQTDSTRLVTILLGGTSLVPPIAGVSLDHHNLSHHGLDADKLAQLSRVESETMRTLRDFLARLKATREDGDTLLDRTSVFFGSNLGSGNSHSCRNLPVLVAGGGFRHGQHLAFNPTTPPPLANLFVSLLERLGVDTDRFGSSTGTLTGL